MACLTLLHAPLSAQCHQPSRRSYVNDVRTLEPPGGFAPVRNCGRMARMLRYMLRYPATRGSASVSTGHVERHVGRRGNPEDLQDPPRLQHLGRERDLEDYALRYTPRSFRKWSEFRVANTAFGAVSFLALEAIGGAIALNYGFTNAFWAILAVGLIIFLTGLPISYYAAQVRRRHGPADPRRRLRLHRLDHHLADLRVASPSSSSRSRRPSWRWRCELYFGHAARRSATWSRRW